MHKLFLVLMLCATQVFGSGSSDNTDEYYHRPNKMYSSVQVICQAGYTFVLATMGTSKGQGIALEQVMVQTSYSIRPQPLKCSDER